MYGNTKSLSCIKHESCLTILRLANQTLLKKEGLERDRGVARGGLETPFLTVAMDYVARHLVHALVGSGIHT